MATAKQKEALSKGKKIQMRAMQIMKAAGKKTIAAKSVYRMTLGQAMKKAAAEVNAGKKATKKKVATNKKRAMSRKRKK
jgi:hypothetical protein